MQLTDILAQTGGLQSIARELGVDESQVASGAGALLPAILGGLKNQAQAHPAGLGGLGDLLGQLGGGGLLDSVLSPQPTDVNAGNDVLGQIFGSRDVSRAVAQNAAAQSGLSTDLLKKMLPMLAMLVTGYMAKHAGGGQGSPASAGGGGGGGLGGLGGALGGSLGGSLGGLGGLGGMLGSVLGGAGGGAAGQAGTGLGGLAAMLDANGDGNALDDILRMVGKAGR